MEVLFTERGHGYSGGDVDDMQTKVVTRLYQRIRRLEASFDAATKGRQEHDDLFYRVVSSVRLSTRSTRLTTNSTARGRARP
jgi:hypothetical protein